MVNGCHLTILRTKTLMAKRGKIVIIMKSSIDAIFFFIYY
jgi:hypothetical protein